MPVRRALDTRKLKQFGEGALFDWVITRKNGRWHALECGSLLKNGARLGFHRFPDGENR
jgi:hypothetical protein